MSLKIIRGKTLPIGLDVGSSSVKMAQLRCPDGVVELLAAESAQFTPECRTDRVKRLNELTPIIRQALRSGSFKSRQCVLSLPADETFVQHVKVSKTEPREVGLAIRRELEGKLAYPVKEAVVRHIIVGDIQGEGGARQEAIVVATPRATLKAYLAAACRAKLDVAAVNIESCAIVECFARLFNRTSDTARTILYVDVGSTTTQVVLAHGRRIVFARNLAIGGDQLDQVVAEGLQIPFEEARATRIKAMRAPSDQALETELERLLASPLRRLTDELTQCLRYHESVFRRPGIERAIFLGGQAYDKRLCQWVAQRLNLPAQVGDPLVRVRRSETSTTTLNHHQPQPGWAVAVGLSLGAIHGAA